MKQTQRRQIGKPVFDLIEEATHLLRTAPAATLAAYYLGTIPFVLGLLFFWADMSRSPLAPQSLAAGSLGVSALFIWMKFWQADFAARVCAQAAREPLPPLTWRRALRILVSQIIIQPSGLFLLPLASIPLVPFAWVYAFYQNATVLDRGEESGVGALMKNARRHAKLWPRQNHLVLTIISVFAFCIFLNWISTCLLLPQLIKMLFGIESDFTASTFALLNTTFFASMFALTYLSVDPILKTIYALRCFYGESLESGEDLKADLKPYSNVALKTASALVALLMFLHAPAARADSTNGLAPAQVHASVPPPDLDRTINQTIHEQKYLWRMPREQTVEPESDKGIIAQFLDRISTLIREWVRDAMHWVGKVIRWILDHLFPRHHHGDTSSGGYGWIMSLQFLLWGLVIAIVVALAIFLYRLWRGRRQPAPAIVGQAILPVPDLADENIRADQLPEDGWIKLARELLERGEFRLAMRAFYLAGLANLAARNLVTIARYKSNRDYERELRRRAHALPGVLGVFSDNLSIFERIWYGMHEASRDMADQFAANLERLRAGQ